MGNNVDCRLPPITSLALDLSPGPAHRAPPHAVPPFGAAFHAKPFHQHQFPYQPLGQPSAYAPPRSSYPLPYPEYTAYPEYSSGLARLHAGPVLGGAEASAGSAGGSPGKTTLPHLTPPHSASAHSQCNTTPHPSSGSSSFSGSSHTSAAGFANPTPPHSLPPNASPNSAPSFTFGNVAAAPALRVVTQLQPDALASRPHISPLSSTAAASPTTGVTSPANTPRKDAAAAAAADHADVGGERLEEKFDRLSSPEADGRLDDAKKRKKRKCYECNGYFSNLATHKSTHLTPTARPHMCDICHRGFARPNDLFRHHKCHWREVGATSGQFTCPFKGAAHGALCSHSSGVFSRCDTYKNHLKAIHFQYPPGTKKSDRPTAPGQCKSCNQSFANVDTWLTSHVETRQCPRL